jgi:hypothetical protein
VPGRTSRHALWEQRSADLLVEQLLARAGSSSSVRPTQPRTPVSLSAAR